MAIRFGEADARAMGRNTRGVKGIKLGKDDEVVGMVVADPDGLLLTVARTATASGRRSAPTPPAASEAARKRRTTGRKPSRRANSRPSRDEDGEDEPSDRVGHALPATAPRRQGPQGREGAPPRTARSSASPASATATTSCSSPRTAWSTAARWTRSASSAATPRACGDEPQRRRQARVRGQGRQRERRRVGRVCTRLRDECLVFESKVQQRMTDSHSPLWP